LVRPRVEVADGIEQVDAGTVVEGDQIALAGAETADDRRRRVARVVDLDATAELRVGDLGIAVRQRAAVPARADVVALDLEVQVRRAAGHRQQRDAPRAVAGDDVARRVAGAAAAGRRAADAHIARGALDVDARPVADRAVRDRDGAGRIGADQVALDGDRARRIGRRRQHAGAAVARQ